MRLAHMRALCLLAGLLALSGSGCGRKFAAPVERPKEPFIPPPATFIQVASWKQAGWGPTCVLLTRSGALLIAEDSARVTNYTAKGTATQAVPSNVFNFSGLMKPVQIAEGGYDIYVADMGDGTQDHPITVNRYNYLNTQIGPDHPLNPVSQFADNTWVRIKGLSADLSGNLYVSCDAHVIVQQPPNAPADEIQSVIYRYHGQYPGAARDTVADQGTGIGTVVDAHAVSWTKEGVLYVADTGKNWAQQLVPLQHNQGNFKVDGSESGADSLRNPVGITGDDQGHFYVSDTLRRKIYRYNQDGSFDQVVNQEGEDGMLAPTSVTAGSVDFKLYLYVADPAAHLVNVYKFQR